MDKSIASPTHLVLANLLRDVRVGRGMSQSEVATALAVPQSFVSKYESGHRRLDLVELHRVTAVLGLSLSVLVARFEEAVSHAS